MRTIFINIIIVFLFTNLVAQNSNDFKPKSVNRYDVLFLVGTGYVNTGSGYGSSLFLSITQQKAKRDLSFGPVFSVQTNSINGLFVQHNYFFGTFDSLMNKKIKLYFTYQGLFRYAKGHAPPAGYQTYNDLSKIEKDIIATFEHYIGLGTRLSLVDQIKIDLTLIGAGVYIGSVDKRNKLTTPGIHAYNSGITYATQMKISYIF
jgi:hypothetical protein